MTLLLRRSEVAALLELDALFPLIEAGFVRPAAEGAAGTRLRARLGEGSATVLFPGRLPDVPAYSVKVHAKFPGANPAIRGLVQLFDTSSGTLLAVLESSYLTAVRSGVAGALGTQALARPDATQAAVIGAGTQGAWQLRCLERLRRLRGAPPLERIAVYDSAPFRSGRFARELAPATNARLVPCDTLTEALTDSEIIITATWGRSPVLYPEMIAEMAAPGCHITSVGADEAGKVELAPELIRSASFFCDDLPLTLEHGALAGAGLGAEVVSAELGAVLAGEHPGRRDANRDADEVTIFSSVGLPWQDLAAGWLVYCAALERGVGTEVDFLA